MISQKNLQSPKTSIRMDTFWQKELKKTEDGTFNIQQISLIPIFDQFNLQNINDYCLMFSYFSLFRSLLL